MGRNDLIIDVIVLLFTSMQRFYIWIWGFICFRERVEVELNVRCLLSLKWTYNGLLDFVLAHCSIVKAGLEDRTPSDRFLNLLMGFNREKGRPSNSVLDPFAGLASQNVFESYFRHEVRTFPGSLLSPVWIE